MKKIALILGITFSATSFAQVRDIMLKKAGSVLNTKKESSADSTKKTDSNTTQTDKGSNPFAMKMVSKSEVQAEYNFASNVYVQIQNYRKNGEKDGDASNVRYHFSDNDYYGTEMIITDKKGKVTESFGISEFKKGQMVSLINNEGEKTGTAMKFDFQKQIDNASDTSEIKIEKTGRTKTILGYNCEEYIITDKDGNKTETWNTTGLKYDLAKMMAGDRSNKTYAGYEGFMMEMTYLDKDGKKTTWNVVEVNPAAARKVTTAEYNFPY